jgi:hypothetical protein
LSYQKSFLHREIENFIILKSFLLLFFLNSFFTVAFLFFKLDLYNLILPLSLLIIIVFLYFNNKFFFLINLLIFLFFIFSSIFLSKYIFFRDISPDSNTAHIPFIFMINNGYNPIYDFTGEAIEWKKNELSKFIGYHLYYADIGFKGLPYALLPIIKFFSDDKLQLINFYSYIFFIIYVIYSYNFCFHHLEKYSKKNCTLLFLFLLANPIILGQISTGYHDQYVSFAIFLLFYFFYTFEFKKKIKESFFLIFLTAYLGSVIKLNGFFYVNFFILFIIYYFLKKKIKYLNKFILFGFIYFVIIVFVNFNPFFLFSKNILKEGLKFSAVIKVNETNIWSGKEEYLKKNNRVQQFIDSNLSPISSNPDVHPRKMEKFKFFFSIDEFKVLAINYASDIRVGVFGPSFGFLLIVSFVYLLISLFISNQRNIKINLIIIFILGTIFLTTFPVFGRHLPQVYFLVFFISVLILDQNIKNNFCLKILKYCQVFLIFFNTVILILGLSIKLPIVAHAIYQEENNTNKILNLDNKKKIIYTDGWQGLMIQNGFLLKDFDKNFFEVDAKTFTLVCNVSYNFWQTPVHICLQSINEENIFNTQLFCNLETQNNKLSLYLREIYENLMGNFIMVEHYPNHEWEPKKKWTWVFIAEHKDKSNLLSKKRICN